MNKSNKFSPEVRERAVRMVWEQRGEIPVTVGSRGVDCAENRLRAGTLLEWVKRQEVDAGVRAA